MIVVVCLNPALGITYQVPAVTWGGVNRPSAVYARPGATGAGIEDALARLEVPAVLTPIAAETRRTLTVVEGSVLEGIVVDGGGEATAFNEPGPQVSAREFAEFRAQYDKALAGASAVVLSGSLPTGLAAGAYATLIETATAAGVPAVLDTHGEALLLGAAAGPAIGAQTAVASLGADGLLAATGDSYWRARAATAMAGNATGAGDAVAPVAGEFSKADYASALARTDPDEAAEYVAATGVDALAGAIGSSHAMLTRDAVLDLGLVAAIGAAVSVPLVLHGSSGVPDRDLAAAIGAGMTKINIATQLNKVFTAAVRRSPSAEPMAVDPRRYGAAGRDAVASEVTRLLSLLSGGRCR